MREVIVSFKRAEVANYILDTHDFDVRLVYDADGKQKEVMKRITKEDRDIIAVAENVVVNIRKSEKNRPGFVTADNPLAGFVNVKITKEDEVTENIARFLTKVMNQAKMNTLSSTVPRYQIREQLCKMAMNL